jgi:exo-1,4-beta-D-glucosaminidase
MLNSAWPETFWQLYDWYLMPSGAFFGTRAAAQPLNLSYNYADQTVYAVNDSRFAGEGLTAVVRAFDLEARELLNQSYQIELPAAGAKPVVSFTDQEPPTPVWFLDLRLHDSTGAEVARNFYWLSTEPDVLDYENNLWYVTPTKSFADFTALDDLSDVELEISATGSGDEVKVHLANPSDALAFFVELRVVDADGNSILPVLWDDNYVSILPGESRELTARFLGEVDFSGASVAVQGWNVGAQELELAGR